MKMNWVTALAGGAIGAALSIFAVFGAASLGYFPPPSDRQFERYLMAHPAIVMAMAEKAQTDEAQTSQRQLQAAVDKVGLKTYFNPKIAFVAGPANAKRSFVEFFDYNCAHCRNSYPLVQKFYNVHKGDTRFAFVELPIFGKDSDNAARAALAARRQPDKYVAFHFAMMGEPGSIDTNAMIDAAQKAGLDIGKLTEDVKDPGLNKQMAASHALASRTGISGTPFFILNGKAHEGEVDEADLQALSKS
jgi:protein-disulfide isomerase